MSITSNKNTKQIMRDYWSRKKGFDTIRIDNYREVREHLQLKHDYYMEQYVVHKNKKAWNPIGSYPEIYKKLFPNYYRQSGEYSWNYSFVLDFHLDGLVNGNLQIILSTQQGKGTGYEYVSGRKDMIVPFLEHLENITKKEIDREK